MLTTSVPEFASATFLVAIFVFWLDWLPGTSSFSNGFTWIELILPVAVLVLYDFGYVHAHDPRLDGRGHDLAIHPHRHPQGPALQDGSSSATPCATR